MGGAQGLFQDFLSWGGLFFWRRGVYKRNLAKSIKNLFLYIFTNFYESGKKIRRGGVVKNGKIPLLDTASVVEGEIQISKSKIL
jgi:hypothetical protein